MHDLPAQDDWAVERFFEYDGMLFRRSLFLVQDIIVGNEMLQRFFRTVEAYAKVQHHFRLFSLLSYALSIDYLVFIT